MPLTPYRTRSFSLEDAAHLARRTSFGATEAEIHVLQTLGPQKAAERLLSFETGELPDNPFDPADGVTPGAAARLAQARWLHEMMHTPFPLREKLALTWHNHFVIDTHKVKNEGARAEYLHILRTRSLGKFADFALTIARSPAMLRYLDGDQNKKGKPNENFGRELLELFTLGIGHYTEQDVREGARGLTGWTFTGGRGKNYAQPTKFVFDERQHDDGAKIFLGQRGNFGGEDIVRLACAHPATGDFIARKLWRAFLSDHPDEAGVRALGDVYREADGDLRAMTRALLTSEAFYAPQNRAAIVKSPAEYVVGALRAFGAPKLADKTVLGLANTLGRMGQELLHPPTVKGWDGGREWINDTTLLLRMQLAAALTLGKNAGLSGAPSSLALLGTPRNPFSGVLGGLSPAQQTYLTLISPEYALA